MRCALPRSIASTDACPDFVCCVWFTGSNVLEARDLTMTIDGNTLFENLTFRLEPGAILGIVGPNGSGKTTLLKLITKQIQPTNGRTDCTLHIARAQRPTHRMSECHVMNLEI
jgi:ABC-type multidrug transport system ATPase subunit